MATSVPDFPSILNKNLDVNLYYITGASSGLGKALASIALEAGDIVMGISRHCTIKDPHYTHQKEDLGNTDSLKEFQFAEPPRHEQFESITLINNAAIVEPVGYVGELETEDIIHTINLNLTAVVVLSNIFVKQFADFKGRKAIVNITSGAASYPVDGWSVYCSTKAGVNMFTRVAALEAEKKGIAVDFAAIAPGIVDTPMQKIIRSADKSDFSRKEEFVHYKESGQLTAPETAARRIIRALNELNRKTDVVFSVKK